MDKNFLPAKHLYIHIPFCNHICSFCDFKRIASNNYEIMTKYVDDVILNLKQSSKLKQYQTIYLGGGTPNHLPDDLLDNLLAALKPYLSYPYEFSIECNPELVTEKQVQILKQHGINRISLGVQTTNNQILKDIYRLHSIQDAQTAIDLFYKYKLNNVSLDFIYNLPHMQLSDIDDAITFIVSNKIKHVSFYSLEIKENAILNKLKYKLDLDQEETQMLYLQAALKKTNLKRYEISNWAINKKYQSKHNLAYWKSLPWKAIGYGAYGFENLVYYHYEGQIKNWKLVCEPWTTQDYYLEILMMGLRLVDGIDLRQTHNKNAYLYFKEQLSDDVYIENNYFLKAKNIDCLNDLLLKLI